MNSLEFEVGSVFSTVDVRFVFFVLCAKSQSNLEEGS